MTYDPIIVDDYRTVWLLHPIVGWRGHLDQIPTMHHVKKEPQQRWHTQYDRQHLIWGRIHRWAIGRDRLADSVEEACACRIRSCEQIGAHATCT